MSYAALAAGGLPEFAILQTRLGLQCVLQSPNGQMLRKLTDNLLSVAAFDASASDGFSGGQRQSAACSYYPSTVLSDRRRSRPYGLMGGGAGKPGSPTAGLPIGSGEIESAHRYVIQIRLKIAGAWWKIENAEKMLALRVMRANGDWEKYWGKAA